MTATGSGPVAPNQKSERKRHKHTLEYLLKTGDIHNQAGSIAHENPGSVLNENQQPRALAAPNPGRIWSSKTSGLYFTFKAFMRGNDNKNLRFIAGFGDLLLAFTVCLYYSLLVERE
jgi:hypothetical protein